MKVALRWAPGPHEHAAVTPTALDDVLDWPWRSMAEHRIGSMLRALPDTELCDFAGYELHAELAAVLRGWEAARRLGATEIDADDACPSAMVAGARAAAGLAVARDHGWIWAVAPQRLTGSARLALSHAASRVVATLSRPGRARIAIVPGLRLRPAIGETGGGPLRQSRAAMMPFPGLDHDVAPRFALRYRRPLLDTLRQAPSARVGERIDVPPLDPEPALDEALRHTVVRTCGELSPNLAIVRASMRALDRARRLRALVVPTSAAATARPLVRWAQDRGVAVAAMQHGIYAFKQFDGGDRRADVLLSWSGKVAEQATAWGDRAPRLVPVGVPGLARGRRSRGSEGLHTVLVATTWGSTSSALATHTQERDFLRSVARAARHLQARGVQVQVRHHPSERPEIVTAQMNEAGLAASLAPAESIVEAAERADLLIASMSSVAFEAGAAGLPVLMWTGAIPAEVRREHFVAPWSSSLPGTFDDAAELEALLQEDMLSAAVELGALLAEYVQPFSAEAFAAELARLSQG